MPNTPKSATLKVPGGRIYYEARGSGPLLVMIPGGPTDAGIFAGLAGALADRYTALAYDPRGNSRSTLDGAPVDQNLDVHGDDAARLIASLGDEPAYVFGNSGGAQIGLNLAARHPERVRTLVAHEPPCIRILADAAERVAATEELCEVYRREGAGVAMLKFWQLAGVDSPPEAEGGSVPPPEELEMFGRIGGNLDFFFAHGLKPISYYLPDVGGLRTGSVRVVIGVGETSAGQLAHRTALALAEKLGNQPVTFPGDHTGFGPHPQRFAQTLHRVLNAA